MILKAATDKSRLSQFSFVNADCLNIAVKDSVYSEKLSNCERVFGDGSGVRYAAKLTGQALIDNVNGTDLYPLLCEYAESKGLSIYMLGGKDGIAEKAVQRTRRRYPRIKMVGFGTGYFTEAENSEVLKSINESGADILLVAMGAPQQECWINDNASYLNVGAAVGVGGLFDFLAKEVDRAPRWVRLIGFEWIVRLLNDPLRLLKRYLVGNPLFMLRVISQRLKGTGRDLCDEGSLSVVAAENTCLLYTSPSPRDS